MKVTNVLKNVSVSLMMASLVGCVSVSSVGNKVVDNAKSGTVFGAGFVVIEDNGVKNTCKVIKDKDPRCANPDNYELVIVYSRYGYADGAVGVTALVDKNFPELDKLRPNVNWSSAEATFVKAEVVPGQLGKVVEILPKGNCKWSGMPRAGGTVCQAYNYDYHKDFTGIVLR